MHYQTPSTPPISNLWGNPTVVKKLPVSTNPYKRDKSLCTRWVLPKSAATPPGLLAKLIPAKEPLSPTQSNCFILIEQVSSSFCVAMQMALDVQVSSLELTKRDKACSVVAVSSEHFTERSPVCRKALSEILGTKSQFAVSVFIEERAKEFVRYEFVKEEDSRLVFVKSSDQMAFPKKAMLINAERSANTRPLVDGQSSGTVLSVVAVSMNGIIGYNGQVAWSCPEDLSRFKALTSGAALVCGTKTWVSIGSNSLPNRHTTVIGSTHFRQTSLSGKKLKNLDDYLKSVSDTKGQYKNKQFILEASQFVPVCKNGTVIMGGAQIYKALEPITTHVDMTVMGMVAFDTDRSVAYKPNVNYNALAKAGKVRQSLEVYTVNGYRTLCVVVKAELMPPEKTV